MRRAIRVAGIGGVAFSGNALADRARALMGDPKPPVTSTALPSPLAPAAPTDVRAALTGPATLSVAFTRPTVDGGSPITSYKVVCSSADGGVTRWTTGTVDLLSVNALTGGATSTCTVLAITGAMQTLSTVTQPLNSQPINALTTSARCPQSRQPELKHTPVRAEAYLPKWHVFILSRREIANPAGARTLVAKAPRFAMELSGEASSSGVCCGISLKATFFARALAANSLGVFW